VATFRGSRALGDGYPRPESQRGAAVRDARRCRDAVADCRRDGHGLVHGCAYPQPDRRADPDPDSDPHPAPDRSTDEHAPTDGAPDRAPDAHALTDGHSDRRADAGRHPGADAAAHPGADAAAHPGADAAAHPRLHAGADARPDPGSHALTPALSRFGRARSGLRGGGFAVAAATLPLP
jgi:hypothetical protein